MYYALISLALAFLIAFGRHFAVIGRVGAALWFFRHFEIKRWIFSGGVVLFGALGVMGHADNSAVIWVLITAGFLVAFAFFFDMKRFFPEIDLVERVSAKAANIDPSTEIIGVQHGGVAVAYPMEVVIPRHIINDTIEGRGVLISFCAICQSALAFSAEANGQAMKFKVAGVWRRNMIVHDVVTYSLWQQATGECIYGPLKGAQLELISGENTLWGAWLQKHPISEFAEKCVEARKGYFSRALLKKLLAHLMPKVLMPGFASLEGLDPHAMVFGVSFNGVSRAYPADSFSRSVDFVDNFGAQKLNLSYDLESDYLSAQDATTGNEIVVEKHWWLGWKEFHQDGEIWTA